jgi:predicted phage baseplate assembly protein
MSLPAPHLDDRRFQDLVDDAKRLVQRRCPEWTDHNVSDPGVTLIETFATMVDQLLYRLNRVPDRHYVKFLELIGVRLFPPTAAKAAVTFWLSAPQRDTVRIPAGTAVATVRTEAEEAIAFTTVAELEVIPSRVAELAAEPAAGGVFLHEETVKQESGFHCFDRHPPNPGDSLLVGLPEPVPSCVVVLRFECRIEGVGVDPNDPPIVWEAWDGDGWALCEVEDDGTGGFNQDGDVVMHVPASHAASIMGRRRAGWLRCRVVRSRPRQPAYTDSPWIDRVAAHTIGATTEAVHAEVVRGELLGRSEHVPGQRFPLQRRPVVPAEEPVVLEVVGEAVGNGGLEEWEQVDNFADSSSEDRHFLLDEVAGEIQLGPAVREPDGTLRSYGKVPPKGALLRVRSYQTGGGQRGNVARRAIRVLKSSVPYVARVENRRPASGGVDGEDIENAKLRGPILVHTRNRAVTARDYEQLALQAAPEVARVRCVAADEAAEPGVVRVLVAPAAQADELGRLRLEQLAPTDETLERIARRLDERRVIGARVLVGPPNYQGMTVVASLRPRPRTDPQQLERAALEALYRYFNPLIGGPDGTGWPFGRPAIAGEVHAVLQRVHGAELVEEARLFPANPGTGWRGDEVQRLDLGPHQLVLSYEHRVRVQPA